MNLLNNLWRRSKMTPMEEKMLEALKQLAFSSNDCARFCALIARKKYEEMMAAINERCIDRESK